MRHWQLGFPQAEREELIAVAKSHAADMPRLSGEPWASLENLTQVTVVDAVVVSFESDQHPKKIEVTLERDSGKFLWSSLRPRKPG